MVSGYRRFCYVDLTQGIEVFKQILHFYFIASGKTVLEFLNENWRVVTEEFGQPVVDYAINVTVHTTKKFFDAVPYAELLNVPIPKY